MKPFIVPIVLWAYVLSVVLAQRFWGGVYDRLMLALDLSPSQGWFLPMGFNLAAIIVGLSQVMPFLVAIRRREAIARSRQIGFSLCIVATVLCISATVLGAFRQHQELTRAVGELIGGRETDIYAAGEIANGWYSNRAAGVVMQLPRDWHEMSLNTIRRAEHSGAHAVAGGDTQHAEELSAEHSGAYSLFAVQRHREPFRGYNPSLVFTAYDKQAVAATGPRTLQEYANGYAKMPHPYHLRSGPFRQRFGTGQGYYVHLETRFPGATIQQHVYALETETLYLVLIASIMDEADLAVLQPAISTLRVSKP